jgi:hypothetical protein
MSNIEKTVFHKKGKIWLFEFEMKIKKEVKVKNK